MKPLLCLCALAALVAMGMAAARTADAQADAYVPGCTDPDFPARACDAGAGHSSILGD